MAVTPITHTHTHCQTNVQRPTLGFKDHHDVIYRGVVFSAAEIAGPLTLWFSIFCPNSAKHVNPLYVYVYQQFY